MLRKCDDELCCRSQTHERQPLSVLRTLHAQAAFSSTSERRRCPLIHRVGSLTSGGRINLFQPDCILIESTDHSEERRGLFSRAPIASGQQCLSKALLRLLLEFKARVPLLATGMSTRTVRPHEGGRAPVISVIIRTRTTLFPIVLRVTLRFKSHCSLRCFRISIICTF